jgi:hypothetical protein
MNFIPMIVHPSLDPEAAGWIHLLSLFLLPELATSPAFAASGGVEDLLAGRCFPVAVGQFSSASAAP